MKGVVPYCGQPRWRKYGDPPWILVGKQEVIAIEIYEVDSDAVDDGPDVRIPLGEDVVAMFNHRSVLDIGAGLPSQTLRTFEKNDPPAAKREFPGNNHPGETPADNDRGRGRL